MDASLTVAKTHSIRGISGIYNPEFPFTKQIQDVLSDMKEAIEVLMGQRGNQYVDYNTKPGQMFKVPYMGHFHSTLVDNDEINITDVPFKPAFVIFFSEGEHGAHYVGIDNGSKRICMGQYWDGSAIVQSVTGEGATGDSSWVCWHDATHYSSGVIQSMNSTGFTTKQIIAANGYAARVQFCAFPEG